MIRPDSTLADLHAVLQIGFDWTDFHALEGMFRGFSLIGFFAKLVRNVFVQFPSLTPVF
jgi:hypothetical protein